MRRASRSEAGIWRWKAGRPPWPSEGARGAGVTALSLCAEGATPTGCPEARLLLPGTCRPARPPELRSSGKPVVGGQSLTTANSPPGRAAGGRHGRGRPVTPPPCSPCGASRGVGVGVPGRQPPQGVGAAPGAGAGGRGERHCLLPPPPAPTAVGPAKVRSWPRAWLARCSRFRLRCRRALAPFGSAGVCSKGTESASTSLGSE